MLLFDLAGQHKDNCWCGRIILRTSGTFSPAYTALGMAPPLPLLKLPHSIAFQRWVPEKSNVKDTIQYFRLLTKDAAKKGFKEVTGGEYEFLG
jgi:hypothetical protein